MELHGFSDLHMGHYSLKSFLHFNKGQVAFLMLNIKQPLDSGQIEMGGIGNVQ